MAHDDAGKIVTLGDLHSMVRDDLAAAGVINSAMEGRRLIAGLLGLDRLAFVSRPGQIVSADDVGIVRNAVRRRCSGEPVSRIIGQRGFWSFELELSAETLDPRPDTETVVDAVLARMPTDRPMAVVDLGVGSGCILLAILSERPLARGVGVDISELAVRTARRNANTTGVGNRAQFIVGDWAAALKGPVDVVVSNPPYIETSALESLDAGVRLFDPRRALDGGEDGLEAYRRLAPSVFGVLRDGGLLALEIGLGQAPGVCSILQSCGLAPVSITSDLSGIQRCVIAKKKLESQDSDGTVR